MFIREVELFRNIPSHVIDEIVQLIIQEDFPKGHLLFRMGDLADFLYIVEDGGIEISIHGKGRISFLLNQPGMVFGWSALVEPNWYTATAQCVQDSKVIKLDRNRLIRVFEEHPVHGLKIMRRLSGIIATRLVKSYQEVAGTKF